MQEEDRRAVSADAGLARAEDGRALGAQGVAGRQDVLDLETDVVLAALGVLRQEAVDRAVLAQRLDQLDLAVGKVDETDTHPLRRQVEGLMRLRGPEQVAVHRDAGL